MTTKKMIYNEEGSIGIDENSLNKLDRMLKLEPVADDYEPTDEEMMSSFGTKWHDGL